MQKYDHFHEMQVTQGIPLTLLLVHYPFVLCFILRVNWLFKGLLIGLKGSFGSVQVLYQQVFFHSGSSLHQPHSPTLANLVQV